MGALAVAATFIINQYETNSSSESASSMKLSVPCFPAVAAVLLALARTMPRSVAQETDNIDGVHTVYAGDHYADCTSRFCFGSNWGDNGQSEWYVKVTFGQSAATYSGGSCFANTVEYYDWNKLWGKARCGYSHGHQQDSDRFVWRRLQDFHTPANCGGLANCTGIQIATYSYDSGTTPYPNENWDLSKTFSTILQTDVAYILGMKSFDDGSVVHSLFSSDWTLLEFKTNYHSNLCTNYEQGSVLGLYFGGTCTAPEDISVTYEAVTGPPAPSTAAPTDAPPAPSTAAPTDAPSISARPTPAPSKNPSDPPVRCDLAGTDDACQDGSDCCSGSCTSGKPTSRVCNPPSGINPETPAPTPIVSPTPPSSCNASLSLSRNTPCNCDDECASNNCKTNGTCGN